MKENYETLQLEEPRPGLLLLTLNRPQAASNSARCFASSASTSTGDWLNRATCPSTQSGSSAGRVDGQFEFVRPPVAVALQVPFTIHFATRHLRQSH